MSDNIASKNNHSSNSSTYSQKPSALAVSQDSVYREAGYLIRHYSTNRLTIYSFSIPLCFGIGALALSISTKIGLKYYLMVAELIIFASASYSSIIFSTLVSRLRTRLIQLEKGEDLYLHAWIREYFSDPIYMPDTFDKIILGLGILFNLVFVAYMVFL